jgi:hypothetical protein
MTANARFCRVARAMLRICRITALLLPMSACVLPIAPEFQDPPATPNYAPVFLAVEPPIGTIVKLAATDQALFTVTVSDPNAADDLYVRFIVDYPPYSVSNTRTTDKQPVQHRDDGKILNMDVPFEPSCTSPGLAVGLPRHQIMAVLADRPFVKPPPPADLTRVVEPGKTVIATWTLELECKP